jgi:uncharacterized membrane protein YebE (DUF533 family)
MIAAANADGHIDETERQSILNRLAEAELSEEEREFLDRELSAPPSIDSVLPGVDSPRLSAQLYAVSLLAIDVDTKAEEDYLAYLRNRLGLDDNTVKQIHQTLGIEA